MFIPHIQTPTTPTPFVDGDFLLVAGARVPRAAVQMIVAEGGFSVSGGELVGCQRVVVVTQNARLRHNDANPNNALRYNAFIQACPHAVGIPYRGDLHMPACPEGTDPVPFLANILSRVTAELSRQTTTALLLTIAAIGTAIAATALAIGMLVFGNQYAEILFIAAIASPVIAIGMLVRFLGLLLRRQKILQALRTFSTPPSPSFP